MSDRLTALGVDEFLDALATDEPIPAAGAAAAVSTAMASSLVAMAARASPDWPEAGAAAAQAEKLRRRVVPLALADSTAYAEARAVLERPLEPGAAGQGAVVAAALERASEIPLEIADAAADTVELAAYAARHCAAAVRGEALVATTLAEAAVRASIRLVELNLAATPEDTRVQRGRLITSAAARALLRTDADE